MTWDAAPELELLLPPPSELDRPADEALDPRDDPLAPREDAPDPVEDAVAAAGDAAEGVLAGTDDPPAELVTGCPVEVAVETAVEVRLLAVLVSVCWVPETALVAPWTVEVTAPVAVLVAPETAELAPEVAPETAELAPEVAPETAEPTPEVTFGRWGGVTDGSPEATLIEAPMPMAASSATVTAAAAMNERPGIRASKRRY